MIEGNDPLGSDKRMSGNKSYYIGDRSKIPQIYDVGVIKDAERDNQRQSFMIYDCRLCKKRENGWQAIIQGEFNKSFCLA